MKFVSIRLHIAKVMKSKIHPEIEIIKMGNYSCWLLITVGPSICVLFLFLLHLFHALASLPLGQWHWLQALGTRSISMAGLLLAPLPRQTNFSSKLSHQADQKAPANRLQLDFKDLIPLNYYEFIKSRAIQDCLVWSFEYLYLCHKWKKKLIILKTLK